MGCAVSPSRTDSVLHSILGRRVRQFAERWRWLNLHGPRDVIVLVFRTRPNIDHERVVREVLHLDRVRMESTGEGLDLRVRRRGEPAIR